METDISNSLSVCVCACMHVSSEAVPAFNQFVQIMCTRITDHVCAQYKLCVRVSTHVLAVHVYAHVVAYICSCLCVCM
jgi:hypothetical protein